MPRFLKFVCLVPVLLGLVYAPSPARGADSYNELFGLGSHSEDASIEGWWPLQDTAATTVVDDASSNGRDGTGSANSSTLQQGTGGPTSYIPGYFRLNGSSHRVQLPTTTVDAMETANALTIAAWANPDDVGADGTVVGQFSIVQFLFFLDVDGAGDGWAAAVRDSGGSGPTTGTDDNNASTATWQFVTCTWDGTNLRPYRDTTAGTPASSATTLRSSTANPYIGDDGTGSRYFDGGIAGVSLWSRALTTGEIAQLYNGPEPIYSGGGISSPVGTYTVGQTLTAVTDSGNWDSQSNGTLVYAYQWIRADDGTGTNAAEISGATSSTYTLVSGDSGKHIACDILASNDGGSDAAEEIRSAYTSQVSGGGGGPAITPITTSIPGSSVDPIRGTIP